MRTKPPASLVGSMRRRAGELLQEWTCFRNPAMRARGAYGAHGSELAFRSANCQRRTGCGVVSLSTVRKTGCYTRQFSPSLCLCRIDSFLHDGCGKVHKRLVGFPDFPLLLTFLSLSGFALLGIAHCFAQMLSLLLPMLGLPPAIHSIK